MSVEEALTWLKSEAVGAWGVATADQFEGLLVETAEAMAAVSAAPIPEDIEPR